MTSRILEPGEIEALASSSIPELRLPQRASVFSARAARLRRLATGNAMADYLSFIADLAAAQHRALQDFPSVRMTGSAYLARCREHHMPVLPVQGWQRDPKWRQVLRKMLGEMRQHASGKVQEIIVELADAADDLIEAQASKLLSRMSEGLDLAAAPLIAAGLQVYWTYLASLLGEGDVGRLDTPVLCPVCGSAPVASVVHVGGAEGGYRYLHCSLCASEWHMVRIKCSNCDSTKGIDYHMLEGQGGEKLPAVRAESCDECGSYLKIMYMEKDPHLDPVADDLASLPLDLLMAEAGYAGSGANLMLFYGEADS